MFSLFLFASSNPGKRNFLFEKSKNSKNTYNINYLSCCEPNTEREKWPSLHKPLVMYNNKNNNNNGNNNNITIITMIKKCERCGALTQGQSRFWPFIESSHVAFLMRARAHARRREERDRLVAPWEQLFHLREVLRITRAAESELSRVLLCYYHYISRLLSDRWCAIGPRTSAWRQLRQSRETRLFVYLAPIGRTRETKR